MPCSLSGLHPPPYSPTNPIHFLPPTAQAAEEAGGEEMETEAGPPPPPADGQSEDSVPMEA